MAIQNNNPYAYKSQPTTPPPPRALTTSATPTVAKWPTTAPTSVGGANGVGNAPWRTSARQPSTNVPEQAGAQNPYGSQSGPGILENWFNQRATGTDPAFEYAMGRGNTALDNQYAAAGMANSGAAAQGKSDLYANLISQREGQLDSLAAGAGGEHENRLRDMFGVGSNLAGGEAGTMGAYDLASAHSNDSLMQALIQMLGNKAGVDAKANQGLFTNILGGASFFA